MVKKIMLGLIAGLMLVSLLQSASAYTYTFTPSYMPQRYGGVYTYSGDTIDDCRYWDGYEWKWKRDRVCEWINNGDGFREKLQRYDAVVWLSDSYDARYNIQSGRLSGDAFYYHYGDRSETKPSDWRYKTAFDPRVDNEYVKGYNYYYYQPRYDYTSGTYNWRF